MKIVSTDRYYSILFDSLLPKRAWTKAELDSAIWQYVIPLYSELKKAHLKPLGKRAAIEVIHHFKDKNEVKDFDNIESKAVIDCITANLLADDSPQYMSLHFDYCMDTSSYTEVRIWEEDKFFQYKAKQPSSEDCLL